MRSTQAQGLGLSLLESQLEAKSLISSVVFWMNQIGMVNVKQKKQFWILLNGKVRCSISRAHESFCWCGLLDKDRVAASWEACLCSCNLHPYCSQAAEEISPKEAELPILPLLLPFFFFKLYTGTFNGLALTRETKSAFIPRV